MRERLALHAAVFTSVLALGLSSVAWAQQPAAGGAAGNPRPGTTQARSGGQNQNQAAAQVETIRGVVAGITLEGEVVLDHRTNAAARAEGAFLTVVGSPEKGDAGDRERRASDSSDARHESSGRGRHNIYIAWLMPRTKICECTDESAKSGQGERRNQGQGRTQSQNDKKEIAFDQLEVGDHVELQFSPGDESASNRGVHQSPQMRQTHGRHRTFVGFATEITVLPRKDHDKTSSTSNATSNERPR
jgi:hypothetical protein